MTRIVVYLATLLGILGFLAAVFLYSTYQSMGELKRRGSSDLALASDRLVGGLFGYRQLAVAIASDPRLNTSDTNRATLDDLLLHATDFSGVLDFVLLDRDRRLMASASQTSIHNWRNDPFVDRAGNGALGRDVGASALFGRRVFYYAVPVFSAEGPVSRILVAIIDLEAIEAEFRGSRPAIYMTDQSGIIYFSNRSELVLRDRASQSDSVAPNLDAREPFVDYVPRDLFGFDIWTVSAGRYVPRRALHLVQDLPLIGMRAEALVDIQPVLNAALLQTAAAGMVILLFAAVIFAVGSQRRILARANAELEARVAGRTQELSRVNASLRAEVTERKEAEVALTLAQEELVEAGKLSALGKMSAGISHELNQPLMAIRSFAENAATFIDRDDTDTARHNIVKIGDLAKRMGRIIQNFRAFARQEKDKVNRVELVHIVHGAVDLVSNRLTQNNISLHMDLPDQQVWLQGGEVRLQQVVVNLLANAIDAMEHTKTKEIHVSISAGRPITLSVRDTGPGIAEPDRVFEPFYSTKEIGEAEGVGLGLSISYGIIQSFGGRIRGQNDPSGGAVFTVELLPWPKEKAA